MLLVFALVIVLCLFTAGMNFVVWLDDHDKTRNLVLAVVNIILGIFNLMALVGHVSNL